MKDPQLTSARSPRAVGKTLSSASTGRLALPRGASVISFLGSLSADELKRISSQSYIHDNGFAKIVLRNYPDGGALRLHVWIDADAGNESNVHSHRWSFRSAVICGEMEQTIFDIVSGGSSNWYEYCSQNHGMEYSMSYIGSADAIATANFVMPLGFSYSLRAGAYHSVAVNQMMTATIVRTTAPETDKTFVLCDRPAAPVEQHPSLSVKELIVIKDALIRAMEMRRD